MCKSIRFYISMCPRIFPFKSKFKLMKHAITILALMISTVGVAQDELVLGQVTASEWNDVYNQMTEKSFLVKYNPKKSKYYIKVDDWMNKAWIHFSQKEIESMRSVIEKYQEWNNIASENNTKIEKDIPGGQYRCNVSWNAGDNWYFSSGYMNVNFKIFSQSTKRHQMIMSSSKVSSTENEYIDFKMPTLYLDLVHAEELKQIISQENIEAKLGAYNKEKANEVLFK